MYKNKILINSST